ncbi:hypothetical protein E3N88_22979 [Mikania micrantha]|uniref:Uncharacterized protein n=1 Tax=Mikania micrantha TaxID=192012 RepID=A0A5N6NEH6_9ASTR|nr:hypothetical protein E3N88_22979 [Mikania micrantha]
MVPSSLLWRSATPATTFRRALFQPPPFYTRRMVSFLLTTACQRPLCRSSEWMKTTDTEDLLMLGIRQIDVAFLD